MIKVLSPGVYSSVQDMGRTGFASLGVPVSGALDSFSFQLGNQLLNNDVNAAVIEVTQGNTRFEFLTDTVIAITGADLQASLNGIEVNLNSVLPVPAGAVVSFTRPRKGIRAYLAVKGGIQTDRVLGSRSYYKGITKNVILQKGAELPIRSFAVKEAPSFSSIKTEDSFFTSEVITCTKAPEFTLLDAQQQSQLLGSRFTISKDNNRMGYRLEEIIENNIPSMLTGGVLPGTVQLTPSGKLIVLMRDCQVTGGYPRVLQLTDHAMVMLSQKIAGQKIKFRLKQFFTNDTGTS